MAIAERSDPYVGSHFSIEIEGIEQGSFSEVGGLQMETEVMDYAEGGNNGFVHKLPGRTKWGNITLKRGLTDSVDLWTWHEGVSQGKVERKDVSIVQFDNELQEVRRWNLRQAFPVKWVGPAWNATTPAVAIETLEIAHHGFEVE
jgi:phage tail-like protein